MFLIFSFSTVSAYFSFRNVSEFFTQLMDDEEDAVRFATNQAFAMLSESPQGKND